LSGRVLEAETGKPLRRALVRASSSELPRGRTVSTDADGQWALQALPAGSYRLSVSKGGYVEIAYGQVRPFAQGRVIEVAEGQALDKLDVSLPRAGVITGRVLDELGDPMSNVRVTVMAYRYAGGGRRLMALAGGDATDDIGQYRLHGLSPGEYYVSAFSPTGLMFGESDDRTGFVQTFYPSAIVPSEAQRVSVTIGQETSQINITMTPMRVAQITGTAFTASGKPLVRGTVMLVTADPTAAPPMGRSSLLKPDGSFTLSGVAPGEYRIVAQYRPEQPAGFVMSAAETASVPVTVAGQDVSGVIITTAPGATARGRIRFEGGIPPGASPASISVLAVPVAFSPAVMGGGGRVLDDWTFEATGLSERRRFRIGNPPSGWFVKSVVHDGLDITDAGMEFHQGQTATGIVIVLTQRVTDLTGSVHDSSGRTVSDYVVVAFSSDSAKWGYQTRFVRSARPNQEGRFSIKGLPPDDYLVVALEYIETGEETDPDQLERWRAAATRVPLTEGEARTINLKVSR
jgi:protocatechuate 3,4-dioxygenase beta subunit